MRDLLFMLIPVDQDIELPVTVVLLSPEPEILQATLRRMEYEELRLEVPAGTTEPPVGSRLIVNAGERTKLTGRVLSTAGVRWVISRDGTHATDDRAAPRVRSRIRLRWRPATEPFDPWLTGGSDLPAAFSFDGGGDLSLSGVRFDLRGSDTPAPAFGDRLFIELLLGRGAYRVLGIVRRVEGPPNRSVAVEFLDVPEETFDALSQFTLDHI